MLISRNLRGYTSGLYSGFSWGLGTVLLGLLMASTPFLANPFLVVYGVYLCSAFHDLFASLWLWGYMGSKASFRGELKSALRSKELLYCALGAVLGGPIAMTFYMNAISLSGSSVTASVTSGYPILGAVLARILLKEEISKWGWLGLVICVLGIALLGYTPDTVEFAQKEIGILYALGAAVGWASEAVICGYGMKKGIISPQMALLVRETTSAVCYMLILLPLVTNGFDVYNDVISLLHNTDFIIWVGLAMIALIGVSSFLMWYNAISLIGASKALCLNVTYALWAVIFTLLLNHGGLSWNIFVGALMMVIGVSLNFLQTKK